MLLSTATHFHANVHAQCLRFSFNILRKWPVDDLDSDMPYANRNFVALYPYLKPVLKQEACNFVLGQQNYNGLL